MALALCLALLIGAQGTGAARSYRVVLPAVQQVAQPHVVPPLTGPVLDRVRAIYRLGQTRGNRPNVFMKLGDSITHAPEFLQDATPAAVADRPELSAAVAFFATGRVDGLTPFRLDRAARGGWRTADLLSVGRWDWCPDGVFLECEIAHERPAFALVMIGTNDLAEPLDRYRHDLEQVAETLTAAGVVPVLSTVPPWLHDDERGALVPELNRVVVSVATARSLPLWDYWLALRPLPGSGLGEDGVHPTVCPCGSLDFSPTGLRYGYNVRNLNALQILAALRAQVVDAP